ncbi:diacylglycerol kinase family protein [uncultured Tessaracoccus sp.]|uniref:diacylglycerol/lipid kinase family protein n=1 Tax=uncultured Tessaracoccus sp. TaxID=905023 RepID=UPI0025FBA105|nr:YegS/Rv2252/BmrU family lipid kinase [uncultured Tessaracoccus sp.]
MHDLAKPRLLTLVVNPRSGGGRAGRMLPKVVRRLHETLPTTEVTVVQSTSWEDARASIQTAAAAARPEDTVAVMGGDGMAHLGLNGCAHTDATLAVLPAGTGNDFARALGIRDVGTALDSIAHERRRVIDLTRVDNETLGERRVGAVVSSGYDARVNRATNDTRLRFGALSYGYIALRELANFEPLTYRLVLDGEPRQLRAMLVAVCNTGIFGGGMRIGPDADPADGLLDLTIVHPVSRGLLLRMLPSMYSGSFVSHPAVERVQARRVELDGEGLFLMGDGEELGAVPAALECEPGALRVFVG